MSVTEERPVEPREQPAPPAVTNTAAPTRLGFLDGLRGFAAAYVVISHCWDTVMSLPGAEGSPLRAATGFMGFGRYAVTLFIIISGFSLGLVAWRNGLSWPGGAREFARRRIRRIVPPYAAAVAISSLLGATVLAATSGTLWDGAIPIRLSGVASHLALVQDVLWAGPAGSTAFWSIAVEFHIYAFFVLILFAMRRRPGLWLPAAIGLAGLATAAVVAPGVPGLDTVGAMYPSLYAVFLLGVAASRFALPEQRPDPRAWRRLMIALTVGGVGLVAVGRSHFDALGPLNDLWLGPLLALFVAMLATGRLRLLDRLLGSRPAVWLGQSSYSLYLIHAVVLEIVWRTAVRPLGLGLAGSLLAELVIGVAASVAAARGFYWLVERHFVNAPRKRAAAGAAAVPRVPALARVRALAGRVRDDHLYRASLLLLLNTALLSALGFVFWAVAARSYDAASVGVFTALISAVTLLTSLAGLGLPNTLIRHLAGSGSQRSLVRGVLVAVVVLGGGVSVVLALILGHTSLPVAGDLQQDGITVPMLTLLVVLATVSGTCDGGLVALRSTRVVIAKNTVGSAVRIAAVIPLAGMGAAGLFWAYAAGGVVTAAIGGLGLWRRLQPATEPAAATAMLRRHASFSLGNYLGTAVGILPMTVVPLMVLSMRGAREAAWFAMAFLVAGFLNFIPSTSSQALFAEASRESVALRTQVGKAVRGIYTLLLPAIAIVAAGAPLILALFGPDYAEHATGALRALALSAVFAGGTYLVDAVLASRDRVVAYIFMNVVNAALVLGLVAVTLPDGLTNGALGWMAAQAASLVIGFGVLAATGLWRPFPRTGRLPRRSRAAHDSILDNPAT